MDDQRKLLYMLGHIYMISTLLTTQYNNIKKAGTSIGQYVHTYNFERRHFALDYQTSAE